MSKRVMFGLNAKMTPAQIKAKIDEAAAKVAKTPSKDARSK